MSNNKENRVVNDENNEWFKHKPYRFLIQKSIINEVLRYLKERFDVDDIGEGRKYIVIEKNDLPPVEIGLPAPDFKAFTLDSTPFQLSKQEGKLLLLHFCE